MPTFRLIAASSLSAAAFLTGAANASAATLPVPGNQPAPLACDDGSYPARGGTGVADTNHSHTVGQGHALHGNGFGYGHGCGETGDTGGGDTTAS
jgi:hypothetical protein